MTFFVKNVTKLCRLHNKRHKHSTYSLHLIAKQRKFPFKQKNGYYMKFSPFLNMFSPRKTSVK
jgi:hypothetical protein